MEQAEKDWVFHVGLIQKAFSSRTAVTFSYPKSRTAKIAEASKLAAIPHDH